MCSTPPLTSNVRSPSIERMFAKRLVRLGLVAALAVPGIRALAGPEERPAGAVSHRVALGETLWGIARRLEPSGDPRPVVERIMRLNDMRSPTIVPGQRLRLPDGA